MWKVRKQTRKSRSEIRVAISDMIFHGGPTAFISQFFTAQGVAVGRLLTRRYAERTTKSIGPGYGCERSSGRWESLFKAEARKEACAKKVDHKQAWMCAVRRRNIPRRTDKCHRRLNSAVTQMGGNIWSIKGGPIMNWRKLRIPLIRLGGYMSIVYKIGIWLIRIPRMVVEEHLKHKSRWNKQWGE